MATKNPIARGLHLRDARPGLFGKSTLEWIVEDLFTGTDGIEYARLSCASDPTRRKTLSLAVLGDRREFMRTDA